MPGTRAACPNAFWSQTSGPSLALRSSPQGASHFAFPPIAKIAFDGSEAMPVTSAPTGGVPSFG